MLLTFDDGYRDNFDLAAPILRERNVSATFFIPSGFIESPRLPWWDHIAYVIKQTNVMRFVLDCSPTGGRSNLEIDLRATSRTAAITTIVPAFLDEAIADEAWFLDQLTECCEVEFDSEKLGRELFMSWTQVQELADSNMAIGSHAHSHRKLARLNQETQRRMSLAARNALSRLNWGVLSRHLHTRMDGQERTRARPRIWRQMPAICLPFPAREGINRFADFDRYEVRRLGVGSADTAALLWARYVLQNSLGKSFL